MTTDSANIDKGAMLILGGYYNGLIDQTGFATVAGRKENNTANNTRGYLQLGTNGFEGASIDSVLNFQVGLNALATNAAAGFLWIPTCAGPPTGIPVLKRGTGLSPMVYDSVNNNFYMYNGGWKKVGLT